MPARTDAVTTLLEGVLRTLTIALVDREKDFAVTSTRVTSDIPGGADVLMFTVQVHPSDFGKVLGAKGKTATALRLFMKAAGRKHGLTCIVQLMDPSGRAHDDTPTMRIAPRPNYPYGTPKIGAPCPCTSGCKSPTCDKV